MANNENNSGDIPSGFTPFIKILSRHTGEGDYATVDPSILKKDAEAKARVSAAEIVKKGEDQAGQTRQKAHDEGFRKGREEGLAEVKQEYAKMLSLLRQMMQGVEARCRGATALFAEQEVLELVKAMVERLVNHEVSVNPRVIAATLRKALGYVVENSEVKVCLNPDDFNRLKEAGLSEAVLLDGLSRIQLVEDHSIEVGGCLLNTDFGEIDATLNNRCRKLYHAVDQAFMAALVDDPPAHSIESSGDDNAGDRLGLKG